MEKNKNFQNSLQDLLNQINPNDITKDIQELPEILKVRENLFNRFLPSTDTWRKQLALELIMCKAVVETCEKIDTNLLLHPQNITGKMLEEEIYKAGFPKENFDEMLKLFIKETKQFLMLYIKDLMTKADPENSQTIYFRSCFLPASISKDVLVKYLKSL